MGNDRKPYAPGHLILFQELLSTLYLTCTISLASLLYDVLYLAYDDDTDPLIYCHTETSKGLDIEAGNAPNPFKTRLSVEKANNQTFYLGPKCVVQN